MEYQIKKRRHTASIPATAAGGAAAMAGPQHGALAALSRSLNAGAPVRQLMAAQAMMQARTGAPHPDGLPASLKANLEATSGMRMDQVRVHYNSNQPAQLRAHAFTRGHDIHVAPGQERHLPHEAWHVVQQAQGRVTSTVQMHNGVSVNTDAHLEREADVMGARIAAQSLTSSGAPAQRHALGRLSASGPVQLAPMPPGLAQTHDLYNAQDQSKGVQFTNTTPKPSFGSNLYTARLTVFSGGSRGRTITAVGQGGMHGLVRATTQLDHRPSWNERKAALLGYRIPSLGFAHLSPQDQALISAGYFFHQQHMWVPTVYAARMYYNDFETLFPAAGGENASAGAAAVHSDHVHETVSEELYKDHALRTMGDYILAFNEGLDQEGGGSRDGLLANLGALREKIDQYMAHIHGAAGHR